MYLLTNVTCPWSIILAFHMSDFLHPVLQQNLAQRMQRADQRFDEMPECNPNKLTWTQYLFNNYNKECSKFYEDMIIDPLWETKPTTVSDINLITVSYLKLTAVSYLKPPTANYLKSTTVGNLKPIAVSYWYLSRKTVCYTEITTVNKE